MKTEKEIRDALGRDLFKFFPKTRALQKVKSLDTHLDVLEIAEASGVNAHEAWQAITEAVQESEDFWDYCLQWAYETLGEPDISCPPLAILVHLTATRHGIDALREAYTLGY